LILSTAGLLLSLAPGQPANFLVRWLILSSALPIFSRAIKGLVQRRKLTIDSLDATATIVLALQSDFRTASFMVWLLNVAEYIRNKTMDHSMRVIGESLEYRASMAWVVRQGRTIQAPLEEAQEGETVVVYPGELIPVDGEVISGEAVVDQRVLTGESNPVLKKTGDDVYAATVVSDGKLYIRTQRIGEDTEAAKVVRMIQEAPLHETRVQNYAEQWAEGLVPFSFLAAAGSAIITRNVRQAAALLIIDYETGLRIAAPTTVLASMTKAAQLGIIIKGGRYLEQLADIDAIIMDKTGTLTAGTPEVLDIRPFGNGTTSEQVLAMAAGSEQRLSHPVALSIVRAAQAQGVQIPDRISSEYSVGLGVEAAIDGRTVHVGSYRFLEKLGIPLHKEVRHGIDDIRHKGASPICVSVDGGVIGLLACSDPLRPEVPEVIRALRERGMKEIVMITGDSSYVAKSIAEASGITSVISNALPEDKVEYLKKLQKDGYKVGFVGDGINDGPGLALADVAIAVEGATAVARETSGIVLVSGGLWKIPLAIDISRESMSILRENWRFIWIPNTVALGLSFLGVLGAVGATVISNGSHILATFHALRLLLSQTTLPVPGLKCGLN
jgi:Cu2+-exporting ATPase